MFATAARLGRQETIGWIGLGAMGHPMAINLFTKTYLAAHKQTSQKSAELPEFLICEQDGTKTSKFVEDLRQKGGSELASKVQAVDTGREMALEASKILTMLPSTPQVESVYLDTSNGILAGLKELSSETEALPLPSTSSNPKQTVIPLETVDEIIPHTILIDQTTLDPTFAMSLAEKIQSETLGRAVMLDAPVSGGTVAAAAGSLTIMFGSPSNLANLHALPLLQRMAREGGVIPCGKNGSGVGVKVCNNVILAINQIALAEGLALGRSLGIDPVLLHSVINSSSGQSWSSRVNTPLAEISGSPGERGYTGGFQSRLMLKDVGLALHAAHTYDLPTPLAWAAKSVYDAVCEENDGELATKDFSVVFEWLKRKQRDGVERGWKEDPPEQ